VKFRCAAALFFSAGTLAARLNGAPDANEIVRQMIERSADARTIEERESFGYQRVSRIDYLNDTGAVRKSAVHVYEINQVNGKPSSKLVQINGHPPVVNDEKKRSAARETGDKSRNLVLTEDILKRYQYTFRGEDRLEQRPVWILSFVPKANLEEEGFFDRLINGMTGTVWVDQEDFQLARASIHLGKKVSFFGGIAGAIEVIHLAAMPRSSKVPRPYFVSVDSLPYSSMNHISAF